MHTFPRPQEPHLSVERVPVDGACPACGAAGARLVPRARRGRLVGRRQVPGVPDLGVARARAARWARSRRWGSTIAMIGVDVGGTFTDVVAVRDGRIEVTKVPSDASRARDRGRRGRAAPRRRGQRGVQPREHDGAQRRHHAAAAEGRVPHHRGLPRHPRPRHESGARSTGRPTRPGAARSATPPARSSRATCAAASSSGCSPTAASCSPLDEDQARRQLAVLARCKVEGVAICLLNAYVNPAHEQRLRELTREVLGDDVAVSISSETSPLAKEYARASTTVDRRLHEAHLHGATRRSSTPTCASSASTASSTSPTARRRCCPGARRSSSRSASSSPAPPPARSRARASAPRSATGNLLCADVGGTSTDVSLVVDGEPFVNDTFELEHDLVINALSTEMSSVGAGGGSIVSISPSGDVRVGPASAGSDPGPGLLRARRHRADADRRLPADGHPRPGRLRRRRDAARPRARAAGLRGARHAAVARAAGRLRLPHRGRQHRRGGDQRRRPPRRRPARLHARGLRRRRPDAAAGRARPAAGARGSSIPPHPGLFSAIGPAQHRPRLLREPQLLRGAEPRQRGAGRGRLSRRWSARCASGSARPPTASRCAAASTGGCSARAGRRRSSRSPDGPIDAPRRCPRWSSASTTRTSAATATASRTCRSRASPTACSSSCRPRRSSTTPRATATATPRSRRRARSSCATSPTSRSQAGEYERERLPVGARIDGPGDHPRGAVDHLRLPGPGRRGRPLRRDRRSSRRAAHRLRDLDDAEFAERYGCDRFTATVLANRFGYVVEHMCSAAAHRGVLADPARLLRLRRHHHRPADVGLRDAGDEQQHRALHRARWPTRCATRSRSTGPSGSQPGDVIVANDPYRTGTHVNDMLFMRPVFHDGELVAFVNLKAHQLDMGGAVPGGFSVHQAHRLRERPRALAARRCSAPASPCARRGA